MIFRPKKVNPDNGQRINNSLIQVLIIIILSVFYNQAIMCQENKLMIRISEIEIDSTYLKEYKVILKEESRASVELEPGVISIFPMFQKENPTQIRILEIYANHEAYQSHLKTQHFIHYKSSTLKMVKSLKLVDMNVIDQETMSQLFKKL
jgi:quinol monooxygenase YgiN